MPTKIMIVDDEEDITLVFKMGLEESGFEVDIFNDPVNALKNFKPRYYDLLLLDIKMPKMNGCELYDKLIQVDAQVKVLFITAFETDYQTLHEQYPLLPRDPFIRKPIEIDDLVSRINYELR
jgi:DNA-binding response OmpR family regulator